jgi:hypothetical protein
MQGAAVSNTINTNPARRENCSVGHEDCGDKPKLSFSCFQ